MPVKLTSDIDSPARIVVDGTVGLRAAIDIVDLADLLAPEAVIVTLESGTHLTADALTHLATGLRRRDVWVDPAKEDGYTRFVLSLVGIPTLEVVDIDRRSEVVVA